MKTVKGNKVIKKLDKCLLNDKWSNGGRKTSKWCNYYLSEKDGMYYLVEKANFKAYFISILLSPVILLLVFLMLIYKALEMVITVIDLNATPVSEAYLSLFTKDKVRTDLIKKDEVSYLKDM